MQIKTQHKYNLGTSGCEVLWIGASKSPMNGRKGLGDTVYWTQKMDDKSGTAIEGMRRAEGLVGFLWKPGVIGTLSGIGEKGTCDVTSR